METGEQEYEATERNRERAERVAKALAHYKKHGLREGGRVEPEDVQDFLTDAMHYAAQRGLNWGELHRMATSNFEAEAHGREDW